MKEKIKNINKTNPTSDIKFVASDCRGITLIALIITIIIMLILATVTIGSINGGLFEYAGKAKRNTEVASEKTRNTIILCNCKRIKQNGKDKYTRITKAIR